MTQLQVTSILLYVSMVIGQIVTPIASQSTSTCGRTNCTVGASAASIFRWEQKIFNTTIVAATVITIMNTAAKTSRVTTVFNTLPDRYTLQPTNDKGTLTQKITYTHLGSTITSDLAFPTIFNGYIDNYHWNGTLAANNGTSCLTAKTPSTGTFSSFPPQPTWSFPTYEYSTTTITSDTKGLYFSAVTHDIRLGMVSGFYSDIAPIKSCVMTDVAPAIARWTAQFLTQTSISYEGSGGITTPVPVPEASKQPSPASGPSATPPVLQTSAPQSTVVNAPKTTPTIGPSQTKQPTSAGNEVVMGSLINSVVNVPAASSALTSASGQSLPKNSPSSSSVAITSIGVTNGVSFTRTYTTNTPISNQLVSSTVAEVTSTGITNGVSFTSTYTTLIPVSSQLVASNAFLLQPCIFSFVLVSVGLLVQV